MLRGCICRNRGQGRLVTRRYVFTMHAFRRPSEIVDCAIGFSIRRRMKSSEVGSILSGETFRRSIFKPVMLEITT